MTYQEWLAFMQRYEQENPGYSSSYTGLQFDTAIGKALGLEANPVLAGTESALTGLQLENVKYKVPVGDVKIGTITLSGIWSGTGPYTQTVTVTGAVPGANTRVDLQPSAAQLEALMAANVSALVIENNNGTLIAYSFDGYPSAAMTVQCTLTEVSV